MSTYKFFYHTTRRAYVPQGVSEEELERLQDLYFDEPQIKRQIYMTRQDQQEQFYEYMKNSDWIEAYKCHYWLTEFPHHVVNVLSLANS